MQLDVFTTWSRCIQVYPCMFGTSSIRVIHFEIQTRGALLACSWFLFGRSPISRKNQHEGKGLINFVQDDCDSTALPWSTSSQPEGCGRSNCSDRSLGRVKSIQKNRNDWKGDPHISLWVILCTSTCATKHLTHLKDIYIYNLYNGYASLIVMHGQKVPYRFMWVHATFFMAANHSCVSLHVLLLMSFLVCRP